MGGGAHPFAGGGATGSPTLRWFAESRVRVWLYRRPTDMRRSFDGLSAMVKRELGEEPTSGAVYVFVNRGKTLMKVLYFERSGYCVWSKRLEQGQFQVHWADVRKMSIDLTALKLIIEGNRHRFGASVQTLSTSR